MGKRRAMGADISHWQGAPDFIRMRQGGVSFLIVKASQNLWADDQFERSWRESKKAGILRGAYHFYDLRNGSGSAKEQARFFAKMLKRDLGELRPVLDFESPGVAGYPSLPENPESVKIVTNFMNIFHQETGVWPMLYTNLAGIHKLSPLNNFMKSRELWIAWYNTTKHNPQIGEWPTWRMWQYKATGNGLAFGVESKALDMNAFNGTEEDLYEYANSLGISKTKLTLPETKGLVDAYLQGAAA